METQDDLIFKELFNKMVQAVVDGTSLIPVGKLLIDYSDYQKRKEYGGMYFPIDINIFWV